MHYNYHFISGTLTCPSNVMTALQRERGHYAVFDQKCYERVPYYQTWTSAEQNCRSKGGHLVTINSAREESFIVQFLARFHLQSQVWIGLHDRGHEEVFTWISGRLCDFVCKIKCLYFFYLIAGCP